MDVPRRTAIGEQPRYSALEPLTFQSLCKEILQADPRYRNVQVYGVSGQAQQGIDILAEQLASTGLTVGQCKRYQTLTDRQVVGAIKEFLKYRKHWQTEGVDTFILFVSCDATNAKVQAEFLRQRRRLKNTGISFELWSDSTLTGKLRSQPGIVSEYLGNGWPQILCGGQFAHQPSVSTHLSQVIVAQFEQISTEYADAVERDLEAARESWRSGNRREAQTAIDRYRQPQTWPLLTPTAKASICRTEAQIALEDGQIELARRLLTEAKTFSPDTTTRLEALVLRAENHRKEAQLLLQDSADLENIALHAAISIELGLPEDAFAKLAGMAESTDTHRLRALAHLMKGEIQSASAEIDKALAITPSWTITRYTAAVVDYYACLSPCSPLAELPPWPEPSDWSHLKSDDESRARLARAALTFRALQSEPNTSLAFGRILATWELACIASDASRRDDANRRCTEILTQDPANAPCLVWAKSRRLDVDTTQARAILERSIQSEDGGAEATIALLICLIEERDLASAKKLLEDTKDQFEGNGHGPVWKFWHDQIAAMNAEERVAEDVTPGHPFEKTALRAHLRTTGDAEPLLKYLAAEHASGDAEATFELCGTYAELARWAEALPFTDTLLQTMQTTEALRICCTILFQTGEYAKCARTIEEHRSWFPASKLPLSFLQMKIGAQERSGEVISAIRSAEDALMVDGSRVNFLNLTTLYLESGDFTGLTQLASRHERYPDLSNEDVLRLSARLATVNRAVGTSLWKRAVKSGVSDEQLGAVVNIGFNLGLDTELGGFLERMASLPEEKGFRRVALQELLAHAESRNQLANTTFEQYRSGTTCLHVALQVFGNELSSWYQRRLEDNCADPTRQQPTYTRHGWRSQRERITPDPGELCADLTSLLLAQYLDILPSIVAAFRPIRIPHATILALTSMREAASRHQPVRVAALHKVQGALTNQTISIFQTESEPSMDNNGVVIDYPAPDFGDIPGVVQPPPRTALSPRIVIDNLVRLGKLPADRAALATNLLQRGTQPEEVVSLESGTTMVIGLAPLEAFAEADVLAEVCSSFRVQISQEEAELVRNELIGVQRAEEEAASIAQLIETLKTGVEAGDFQLLPVQKGATEGEPQAKEQGSLATRCMIDLLTYKGEANHVVWIDDRALNSFVHHDGNKIVDSIDLLHSLHAAGSVNDEALFRCFNRYRASDLRFLSLETDELLFWLNRASSSNGKFTESYELRVLRLSHAKAICDGTALRTSPAIDGQTLEWPFLLSSATAVANAMRDVWKIDAPKALREEQCSWLVDNLLLLDRGRASTRVQSSREADVSIEAITLAELMVTACGTFEHSPSGREARRAYLQWVYRRVLNPRFEADNRLKKATLEQMTQMLLSMRPRKPRAKKVLAALSLVVHTWIEDLPDEIGAGFIMDNGLMDQFGVSVVGMVSAGKMRFRADQFWRAVRDLIRTNKAVALDSARLFTQAKNDYSILAIEDLMTGETSIWDEAPLELLSSNQAQQVAALDITREAFDLSSWELETLKQKLRNENAEDTLQYVSQLRDLSSNHFYQALDWKIVHQASIMRDDLIPKDVRIFLRHLRLDGDGESRTSSSSQEDLESKLLSEVAIQPALERLIALPSAIGVTPLARLRTHTQGERRSIFRHLAKLSTGNPVSLAHLIRLLYTFAEDNIAYVRWAERLVRTLLAFEGSPALGAMLKTLSIVERELSSNDTFPTLPNRTRLMVAWTHASRLQRIFVQRQIDLNWIQDNFGKGWNRLPAELYGNQAEYWRDVSHPARIEPTRLLAALVYYATENGTRMRADVQKHLKKSVGANSKNLIDLLFDASHEPDAIQSVLAESSGWIEGLDEETRELCLSTRHPNTPKEIAQNLMEGGDSLLWAHLQSVVQTGKIPDDARTEIRSLLLTSDLITLHTTSPNVAPVALGFAAAHAGELGRDIVEKVRGELLQLTMISNRHQDRTVAVKMDDMILSSALFLYRGVALPESPFKEIGDLWWELVKASPELADLCRGMTDKLIEALPNADSRHLWKLQVYLRGLKTNTEPHSETGLALATSVAGD